MTISLLKNRGFTLIELMFSMAIGAIILLAAASVLGSSGDGYERVGGGVATEREARAAIGQLTSDLSTALFRKGDVVDKSDASWPADRIGFLCLQPAMAQTHAGRIGDLCAVNYYLADLSINGRTVRCLMRGFRESAETFRALGNDDLTPLFAARPSRDEPVAFGVVSFEARAKSSDTSGLWIDWLENDMTGPDAIETRLVLARRGLAARLKTPGDWNRSRLLGKPSEAARNKDLDVCGTMIGFGNREKP